MEANSFLYELTPPYMGGNIDSVRVASPVIVIFLIVDPEDEVFSRDLVYRKWICADGSKFFPLWVNPSLNGRL